MIKTLTNLVYRIPRAFALLCAEIHEARAELEEYKTALADTKAELLESEERCMTLADTVQLERDTVLTLLLLKGGQTVVRSDMLAGAKRHSFVVSRQPLDDKHTRVIAYPVNHEHGNVVDLTTKTTFTLDKDGILS